MDSKFIFFWDGIFSQWYQSPFTINGMEFSCCEQWMMYNKAMMFNDTKSAKEIMDTNNPRIQKELGRKVVGFDDAKWMERAYDIVVEGNYAKFTQNSGLRSLLVATGDKIIVEASPYDTRWGIGMAAGDDGIEDPSNWKGENLLGKAIMDVRCELIGE